jgi:diaminopimelate epimerase
MPDNGLMRFAKGHGTGNDFVILPDPDGELAVTPALVRALADRRFGIGGDGVLRVVRAAKHPEAAPYARQASPAGLAQVPARDDAEWFMDYHNADGSVAEMCGNGVRVFALYLRESGLADTDTLTLATRSGLVTAVLSGDEVTVDMVPPVLGPPSVATVSGQPYAGTSCSVGNPHLVCPVPKLSTMDLSVAPSVDPGVFPDGANVEFIVPGPMVPEADLHYHMRVYERGSAETLSCGSGACAVAAVVLGAAGSPNGRVAVDVPGGRLLVTLHEGRCQLTGAAAIVAYGEVTLP